jgi:acyl carrier protein
MVEAMVLDVWLLGRSRLLHSAWLQTLPGLAPSDVDAAQQQAWEWLRLAAQSYVGLRRVQRGAELPPSVLDRMAELLTADIEVAARFATEPTDIRDLVIGAVRTALRLGETVPVPTDRPLRALPNFNSFRLVDIIEQVESRLDVTLDAEDLTVETLRDIDTMADLFARAVKR